LSFPFLSTIVFLPVIGAILIAVIPNLSSSAIKRIAAVFTFAAFVLSLILFFSFDKSLTLAMQFSEKVSWIAPLNAFYHLGVDGISLPLVILMTFLGFLVILISWKIELRPKEYFAWLLLLETSILGVFTSLNLLLFFLFWEIEVIPMYFLISVWGSGRKEYSAMKYVIYTLFGSALMLGGILALYFTTGTLEFADIAHALGTAPSVVPAVVIFFLLFVAFATKLPVFPLHTWLPDAHTDAPTAVSVVLAGTLLKMGGYGMIRLPVSLFPEVAKTYAPYIALFAVISILYGAAVTLRQTDIKRTIAYSSVSHMGYVLLGIAGLTTVSFTGAVLNMFSHGIVTGLLFAMAGMTMHNTEERDLRKLGGLARQIPVIALVFVIAGLASLGLPGTSGFAAEFLIFIGSFNSTVAGLSVYTIVAVVGVVVTAGYILWMIQRVFFGPVQEKFDHAHDAGTTEKVAIFALVAVIIFVGIYPAILTDIIKTGIFPVIK
jgi:NADH-quinone oxidoreductase subunit M